MSKAVYDVPSLLGAPEAGGQRNADMHFAYPIIYIHGLLGDSQTWANFTDWFSGLGGEPSTIGYCLNADGSFSNADLEDDFFGPFGSFCANDSYVMTFKCNEFGQCGYGEGYYEVQSSASALYKQAEAVADMVQNVRMATGKDKVVLVGHSMGGLAAREYMLNEEHWNSMEHHVAKLVTVGTPHWGSNLESTLGGFWDNLLASDGTSPPPQSEAVRDLKNRFDDLTENLNPGVSLWGGTNFGGPGVESQSYMYDGSILWDNVDVNCNGTIYEEILGLNLRSFDLDIEYACLWESDDDVVSEGNISFGWSPIGSPAWESGGEDLCACIDSYYGGNPTGTCESWEIDLEISDSWAAWLFGLEVESHSELAKIPRVVRALDEADCFDKAYEIEEGQLYWGAITEQAPNSGWSKDYDVFRLAVSESSMVSVSVYNYEGISDEIELMAGTSSSGGECEFTSVYGSTQASASNNNTITFEADEGIVFLEFSGLPDVTDNYISGAYGFYVSISPITQVSGCTNEWACNYNPIANVDDSSCLVVGDECDDYNPQTIVDVIDEDCECHGYIPVFGCTDHAACNFSEQADFSDGSCTYVGEACDDGNPDTINDVIDPQCGCVGELAIPGCQDAAACNYWSAATIDDGSCIYLETDLAFTIYQSNPVGDTIVAGELVEIWVPNLEEVAYSCFVLDPNMNTIFGPEGGHSWNFSFPVETGGVGRIYVEAAHDVGGNCSVLEIRELTVVMPPLDGFNQIDSGSNLLTLYPNPTRDILNVNVDQAMTVDSEIWRLEILDSSGKMIKTDIISSSTSISTQHYSEGIYIIRLTSSSRVFNGRFMVRRN